jgi:2-polyprenyl-3-methyl-5-hydroxy-6-metoxy-1,4-benzoquinol methylase
VARTGFDGTPGMDGFKWSDADPIASHKYLLPTVLSLLERLRPAQRRLLDLGCGNGALSAAIADSGWEVVGVDPSQEGIAVASQAYPTVRFHVGSAYDDLRSKLGTFPVVISLEVVEHVYAPRDYAAGLYDVLDPGGTAILSTPYHGYLKNLALAVAGRMDAHFTALWDHGHIKFWSERTLTLLLKEAGFMIQGFERVGRIPPLAKSMIVQCSKPTSTGESGKG